MKKISFVIASVLLMLILGACSEEKKSDKAAKNVDTQYVGSYTLMSMGQADGNQLKNYRTVPLSEDLAYAEKIELKKNGDYVNIIQFYDDQSQEKMYQEIIQYDGYTNDGKNVHLTTTTDDNTYELKAYKNEDGSLMMNYDGLKQLQDNGATLTNSTATYDAYNVTEWYNKNNASQKSTQKLFFTDEGHLMSVTYSKADNTTSVLVYEK
ncbi:hypothetical protein QI30_11825 [Kurthia sp. 3B1D]|uniref:Lipoprotein n=1 Tax=Candidatus Kurthia intestinigallinarum TaxID=1562256 RepID=A0A433RTV8_9BACL|nr:MULTISPECIES: hypothetical protein [unclassified Kurthia]RUS55603.1 hypothetical protein QI30_11825 [Kurthia sp. 3B1D]